jgi:hypothetical protein
MLYFPLIGRRATLSQAPPSSSRRPELEWLEDRVVPTYPFPNGTILFTNYHSSSDTNSLAPTGILGIESPGGSEVQTKEAVDGSLGTGSTTFTAPSNLSEDPVDSTVLYVTDIDPNRGGEILKVQLSATSNPVVTVISSGSNLVSPTGVLKIGSYLYVSDTGTNGTQRGTTLYEGYVVKINPSNGAQTILNKTGQQYFDGQPHQSTNPFACPIGMAPAYKSDGTQDTNSVWVGDQGGNMHSGFGPGYVWKVDLTNTNNPQAYSGPYTNPMGVASYSYLSIDTSTPNYALGNMQDIAVDPSTGKLYMSQYGKWDFAGSVVSVDPGLPNAPPTDLTTNQTRIYKDNGMVMAPSDALLGWYVTGDAWDANYVTTGVTRVITAALDKTTGGAPRRGHLEAVDPVAQTIEEVTINPDPNNHSWIALPGGIIVYRAGTAGAPFPSGGHSPTTLGSLAFSTPETMDLSSLAPSRGEAAPAINGRGADTINVPNGVSNLGDLFVADARADQFWEYHHATGVPHSLLHDGLQTSANPWSIEADAYFTMELARSQTDWLVTTLQALGSI